MPDGHSFTGSGDDCRSQFQCGLGAMSPEVSDLSKELRLAQSVLGVLAFVAGAAFWSFIHGWSVRAWEAPCPSQEGRVRGQGWVVFLFGVRDRVEC